MRYMLMHKLNENLPGAFDPSPEFIARMEAFMKEVAQSGILLAAEGLCETSKGATRITVTGGKTTVTDGPFTETKELIAGFALVDVRSQEEAVEWGRRFADVFAETIGEVEVDIRRVYEAPEAGQPA
ncbi:MULTISPECIES: YciI family protein [unclassified Micromonospora]|uniref:YciI family protein n=1 Tax=unclassified Micromonospora TaxID=2617518 RepID=UPI002E1D7EF7|nr:YciI family protein [Micromonospora sp. NBC_00858]